MSTTSGLPPSHLELCAVFLRLSVLGFGGPNAHLALMLDEVERRRWLDRERFLELVAVTNLLPGPNSSEVAIHVGYTQRRWTGALATGLVSSSRRYRHVAIPGWRGLPRQRWAPSRDRTGGGLLSDAGRARRDAPESVAGRYGDATPWHR